jgi:serine/threonine protein kinase
VTSDATTRRQGETGDGVPKLDGVRLDVRPLLPEDPGNLDGYHLLGRIGEGGQGRVYLGTGAGGTRVAIKVLRADWLADPQARERLAGEVAAARRVPSFCTARLLDARLAGPTPYLVTEFVDGPSLQQQVRRHGPLAGDTVERLAVGTLTALITIHNAGLVHHDVKPGNVLLGPDGPRVVDFGIAAPAGTASLGAGSTDGVLATPAFMAPEQLGPGSATPAADLFAWASTMTFAATGRSPFHAPDTDSVLRRVEHDQPDLAGVPVTLRPLLRACLTKDPQLRPTAQVALARLLDDLQPGGATPRTSPSGPQAPAQGPPAGARGPQGPAGAQGAAGAGANGVPVWGTPDGSSVPPPPPFGTPHSPTPSSSTPPSSSRSSSTRSASSRSSSSGPSGSRWSSSQPMPSSPWSPPSSSRAGGPPSGPTPGPARRSRPPGGRPGRNGRQRRAAGSRVLIAVAVIVGIKLLSQGDGGTTQSLDNPLAQQQHRTFVRLSDQDVLTGNAFNASGDRVAALSRQGELSWYQVGRDGDSGRPVRTVKLGVDSQVWLGSLSADGRRLATLTADGRVATWDAGGNAVGSPISDTAHVSDLALSADGSELAVHGDLDGTGAEEVRVWSVADGTWLDAPVPASAASLSPDGRTLAVRTTTDAASVSLVSVDGTDSTRTVTSCGGPGAPVLDGDDRVICVGPDGVAVVRPDGGSRTDIPDAAGANVVAVAPSGSRVALGTPDGVRLLDDSSGALSGPVKPSGRMGHDAGGTVDQLAFDPSGERLLVRTDQQMQVIPLSKA